MAVLDELSRLNNFKLERNDSSWGFLVSQPSAILSPKAKPPTGLHFAQCPAGGFKRPQMAPLRPFCLDTRDWTLGIGIRITKNPAVDRPRGLAELRHSQIQNRP